MFTPNWKQERPLPPSIDKAFAAAPFSRVEFRDPAHDELLSDLRPTHANGGAEFAAFELQHDPVLHWFVSRNRFDEISLFERLFVSQLFSAALPDVEVTGAVPPIQWEWSTSYMLDGDLAGTLVDGETYKRSKRSGREAKVLGQAVCDALFGARCDEVMVFRTHKAWCSWFYDIAWGRTWVVVGKRLRHISVLAVTDTD